MTDLASLLRAVYAKPDDDTPRLVLADWLDDQSSDDTPQWAAFIRAQCRGQVIGDELRKWIAGGGLWHITGVTGWAYRGMDTRTIGRPLHISTPHDCDDPRFWQTVVVGYPAEAVAQRVHVSNMRGETKELTLGYTPQVEARHMIVRYRRGFPDEIHLPYRWFMPEFGGRFLLSDAKDYLLTWPVRSIVPSDRYPRLWRHDTEIVWHRHLYDDNPDHVGVYVLPTLLYTLLPGVRWTSDVAPYVDADTAYRALVLAGESLCHLVRTGEHERREGAIA